jgi:Protein of unknown function (DUF4058)
MAGDLSTSCFHVENPIMTVHDWSRVYDGAFHAFHLGWIAQLQIALNQGLLPPDYYAMAEQVAGPAVADVLTLQTANNGHAEGWSGEPIAGATAVALAPPRVADRETLDRDIYTKLQRAIVIHHTSDDRIIALIEILSAGNKASNREFHAFLGKAAEALERGYHLLLIDLQPTTARDPDGIHAAIWGEFGGNAKPASPDKPLTLVAYGAGPPKEAYVQRMLFGESLIDMPLFLAPGWYVDVPLEATYQAAWRGVPRRVRELLEKAAPQD